MRPPLRVLWVTTMASDGPSKPLVPPPPTLSFSPGSAAKDKPAALPEDDGWLELIEDEPTAPKDAAPERPEGDDPSPAAPIEDEPTAPKTLEGDTPPRVDAEPSASTEPAAASTDSASDLPPKDTTGPNRVVRPEPPPRRGLLPPPKSDGKRVQPMQAKPRPERAARPSAAGLPSGMRPPGAPDATEREDTDVLIASAVAVLTEGEELPAEAGEAAVATAEAPVPDPVALTPPVAAAEEPNDSRRRGLWIGLGAVAALAVAFIAFGSGDDEPPEASSAAAVVAEADPADPPATPPEPVEAAPDADAAPAALPPDLGAPSPPPDVGSEVLALADTLDVGGDEPKLDVGSEDDVEVALAEEPAERDDTRHGKGKRRRKPKAAAAEPSRPAPAAPTTAKPDADALLADARKALAAGQARKAYSLASKSRSAKRTSAALVVMAKAACRFGGEAQAKSAFNQLSVSARRGIRSECRSHGVRLGL